MTLEALLDAVVAPAHPRDPALLDARGNVRATRGELGTRVRARAAAFAAAGLEAGTPVAFGVRQDADGIAWLLGAIRAGIVVVVLDPGVAPPLLEARCRAARVVAVVTDGGVATLAGWRATRWAAGRRGVHLPDPSRLAPRGWTTTRAVAHVPRLEPVPGGDARRPLPADAPAIVVFTSGTTDAPRGVVHTSASIAATLEQSRSLVELGPGDRVLGTGFHLVAPALVSGASVVVPPGRPGTRTLARATRDAGVTHLSLPLHRAGAWADAGGAGPTIRTLLLGSAPVRNAALAPLARSLPGIRLSSVYGMTEHLLVAMVDADERLAFDERDGDLVGRPLPGVSLRTDDAGELHVSGPALARGYVGEPQPVAELASGDLGSLDEDGRLVLRGRRKEMLIRGGENIYPSLYEPALAAAAGLDAALMVGVERPDGDEAVVLFAVPAAGEKPEHARRRLASVVASSASPLDAHARPDLVLAISRVPRAGRSGKPDRLALAAIAAARMEGRS